MPEFKILKGGLAAPANSRYVFADAAATDTRLMGVLGLRIHWRDLTDPLDPKDVYHFYYYDIEEIGLDYLQVYEIDNEDDLKLATRRSFGGLGASMWPLSEEESRYLVCSFIEETKRKRQPLPDNVAEASFITDDPPELSAEQIRNLNLKLCTFIATDYGVINYYLMRLFGKDPQGAELLVSRDADPSQLEDVSLDVHATFLKNRIEEFEDESGRSYLCESLVEGGDSHWIVVSEITLSGGKIKSCAKRSAFRISSAEASMKTTRSEYVTVYEIVSDMDSFDEAFDDLIVGATRTDHETGEMFMAFKPDNSHAEKQEFSLSDDIQALYFVSDYGQMIVGSHDLKDIQDAEHQIVNSALRKKVVPTARYNFVYGIVYDFATSGYIDFDAYLDAIRNQD